jgi:endogenous inhibitor of DNA gyrase (YacG/DUF329 family)
MSSGKAPPSGNGHGGTGPAPAPPKAQPAARTAERSSRGAERTVTCPTCGKPARWEGNPDRPFCSERCRLIDLGQWAEGKYAIPAEKVPDKGEDEE